MKNLNILYEDNHIIVVVKPYNVLSQEDITKDEDMYSLVKEYIRVKYKKPGNVYLGLIHRLDRPTKGIMLFAKTSKAASRLSKQIREDKIIKKYIAVVENAHNLKSKDTLINNLEKDSNTNTSKVVESGKKSILKYKVLNIKDDLALVDINLVTGRHHQIRVQMSNIGSFVYADTKYGSKNKGYLCLVAYYLEFVHPTKLETMKFKINMDDNYPWNIFNK